MIRIDAIICRADRLGASLFDLCREANAPYPTVSRWRSQTSANPGLKLFNDVMTKLESALADREREVLEHLVALHPDAADEALRNMREAAA